jgi:hypothetical protein
MPRRSALPAGAPLLAIAAMALAAGCSAPGAANGQAGQPASRTTGRLCGSGRTSAGVKVMIMVQHGAVDCSTAQAVERGYATALASGKVAGNGGGAPVTVRGWVCQGFNTPDVLRTGNASKCTRHGAEILAVLPAPSASP